MSTCCGKCNVNSSSSSGDFCQTPGGPGPGPGLYSDSPNSCAAAPYPVKNPAGCAADGFTSCTESLGFESSDDMITGEGLVDRGEAEMGGCNSMAWWRARRRSEERRRVVELPPPLTSMDVRGRRDFVLRSVRKDGRLELTEVWIRRPEIMHATRENGRLTLRLDVPADDEDDEAEEEELEAGEEEREGEIVGGSPATGGEGGEATPRRCYEYDVAGKRHLMTVWSPRCVTTM